VSNVGGLVHIGRLFVAKPKLQYSRRKVDSQGERNDNENEVNEKCNDLLPGSTGTTCRGLIVGFHLHLLICFPC